MDLYEITFTAKPLMSGWYRIYKNFIPVYPNRAGVYANHLIRKRREMLMKTKSPSIVLFALAKQGQKYVELPREKPNYRRVRG